MHRRRLGARAVAARLTFAFILVVAVGAGTGLAAGNGWSIVLSPTTIPAGTPSTIKAAITNLGGPDGTRELGCVRISIPLAFTVQGATVASKPPNTKWAASVGIGSVTIASPSGGDRLPPDGTTSVVAAISVLAVPPGPYAWTANAYRQGDCTDGFAEPMTLKVVVEVSVLTTPVPTAVPSTRPSILPSLLPTPRATSTPSPTLAPAPAATPTPAPTAVPGTTPTPAGTPLPGSTPGGGDGGNGDATPTPVAPAATARPTGAASVDAQDVRPSSSPGMGAALVLPGGGPDDGSTAAGEPEISLTSGFQTPFGDGFEWAVPGLVLSVPGLLIVLVAIGAQAFGAAAWLPVVRRRIGDFELDRRSDRA